MLEAFNILKVKVGTEFVVKEAQWRRLAKVVAPDISSSHLELLLRISDEGQKGHVGKEPWPLTSLFPVCSKVGGLQKVISNTSVLLFYFCKSANKNVYRHSLLATRQWKQSPHAVFGQGRPSACWQGAVNHPKALTL